MNLTVEENKLVLKNNVSPIELVIEQTNLALMQVQNIVLREKILSDITIEEKLIGEIDNLNCEFTTTFNYLIGSTTLFINGIRQRRGLDFTENGTKSLTLSEPPRDIGFDDDLTIIYIKDIL